MRTAGLCRCLSTYGIETTIYISCIKPCYNKCKKKSTSNVS